MATRDDIKLEVSYMILAFPNYNPDLSSTPNVVDVLFGSLAKYPAGDIHQAVIDCTEQEDRKFAPTIGEIIHAIKELPFKGMTPSERFEKENGIRPAYEVLQEMGIYDLSDAEQKIKNQKLMQGKETHNEPTF
jgi:hypothetical protein